ncbi:MAG TPA: hypothetical protein VJ483_07730 [Holophagaceae bacterium]|nr:hypothetical protein [Holophagaceae bacterium]
MRRILMPICTMGVTLACGTPGTMPMKADLSGASVTLGPGIVPGGGEAPAPSGFRPTVSALLSLVPAYKGTDAPDLKIWSLPLESQRALAGGASPDDPGVGGRLLKVQSQSFVAQGALLQFEATWEGPAEGRFLMVEVWRKGRREAAAISALEIHYLPAAQPRGREGRN